jgi:hypothetical protein
MGKKWVLKDALNDTDQKCGTRNRLLKRLFSEKHLITRDHINKFQNSLEKENPLGKS